LQGVNKVFLIGNLGQDPEIRHTSSGKAVANITVATNRQYKDSAGNKQSDVEWHKVTVWDKLADICGEYLRKGAPVHFEGRLQTDKWQDHNGNDRYTTKVIAHEMVMLGGGGDGQGSGGGGGNQDQSAPSGGSQNDQPAMEQDFEDDIPF